MSTEKSIIGLFIAFNMVFWPVVFICFIGGRDIGARNYVDPTAYILENCTKIRSYNYMKNVRISKHNYQDRKFIRTEYSCPEGRVESLDVMHEWE